MIRGISSLNQVPNTVLEAQVPQAPLTAGQDKAQLEEKFQEFVGQTLFGQMLKSMRKTVRKSPYFHGGRGEEVFQQQLDQVVAEKMSRTTADKFSGPMFELFQMQRR